MKNSHPLVHPQQLPLWEHESVGTSTTKGHTSVFLRIQLLNHQSYIFLYVSGDQFQKHGELYYFFRYVFSNLSKELLVFLNDCHSGLKYMPNWLNQQRKKKIPKNKLKHKHKCGHLKCVIQVDKMCKIADVVL